MGVRRLVALAVVFGVGGAALLTTPMLAAQVPTVPAGATTQVSMPSSKILATCKPPGAFHPNPTKWHVNPPTVKVDYQGTGMPAAGSALTVMVPADFPSAQTISISWWGNTKCVSFNGSIELRVGPPPTGSPSKERLEYCRNLGLPKTFNELVDVTVVCDAEIVFHPQSTFDERLVSGVLLLPWFKAAKAAPAPVRRELLKQLWKEVERLGAQAAKKPKTTKALQTIFEMGTRKGNFGLGKMSRAEVDELGKTWVGPGARPLSDGTGLISKDGTKVYRFPTTKTKGSAAGKIQANLEEYTTPATGKGSANRKPVAIRNAHVDVVN